MIERIATKKRIATATVDDARAYLAEGDRFIWCEGFLWNDNEEQPTGMGAREYWINRLVARFEALLVLAIKVKHERPIRGYYIRTGGKPELLCRGCWGGDDAHADVVGVERIGSRHCFMCDQTLTEGAKQC